MRRSVITVALFVFEALIPNRSLEYDWRGILRSPGRIQPRSNQIFPYFFSLWDSRSYLIQQEEGYSKELPLSPKSGVGCGYTGN